MCHQLVHVRLMAEATPSQRPVPMMHNPRRLHHPPFSKKKIVETFFKFLPSTLWIIFFPLFY